MIFNFHFFWKSGCFHEAHGCSFASDVDRPDSVNFGRFFVIGFPLEQQSGSVLMECPTREQPVKCGVCGAVVQRRCYRRHLESHSNMKSHVCQLCGKFYTRKDSLQRHVMSVHKLYDTGDSDPWEFNWVVYRLHFVWCSGKLIYVSVSNLDPIE